MGTKHFGKLLTASSLVVCACLFGWITTVQGQGLRPVNPSLLDKQWAASWISCPDAPQKDLGIFYFRRTLIITKVPEHFWVYVSADNRFQLHVNGRYAGEGPARGDLLHWRFETIDLAPFLNSGENVLAAVVWNFGSRAPMAQMSSRTAFLLQGASMAEADADTGLSWRVERETGRGLVAATGNQGYESAGPGEYIDGRLVDWDWDRPVQATPARWKTPELIDKAAMREAQDAGGNWKLVQDLLPPMERKAVSAGRPVRVEGLPILPDFPAAPLRIASDTHITLLLDNQVLQTAYPELLASGGKDADIRITYAEALYDKQGDKGNRNEIAGRHIEGLSDVFVGGREGRHIFAPLWWRTWRYLEIDVTTKSTPLELEGLSASSTEYPFVERASIAGDVPDLQRLWDTGWRTARLSAHETYMDAPYWEQLQYAGDTRIEALVSYAVTGDTRLARQAIANIDASRVPEGITQSRFPSATPQFIPPFSLIWIDMLHDYWMYADDAPFVRQTVPHTRTVIDWYIDHLRPDGLLGHMDWWEFGDWTSGYKQGAPPQDANGGSTFLTLQFVEALKNASELELRFGDQERAAQYRLIIHKAIGAINRLSWSAKYGIYADTPLKTSFSQQANILAVWLDIAPHVRQAAVLLRVLNSKENIDTTSPHGIVPPMSQVSYYFRFYLSRALEHAGLGDLYLDELTPWRTMLNLGLSTWAEKPEPTRSDCHAWSSSPNYDLLTVVAGIKPSAPSFSRVLVEPHLGQLTHLDATMPHRGGNIHVKYLLDREFWSTTISLPKGLGGTLLWDGRAYPLKEGTQMLRLPTTK